MHRKFGIHIHTQSGVDHLEQIQRAAARFVYGDYRRTTHVSPLIAALDWDSLHTRRLLCQATMLFKIHYGLVNIQFPSVIYPATYLGRHDHTLKYNLPVTTIDPYKYSFYPRSVRIWNQLPPVAVLAPSTSAFRDAALPAIRGMSPQVGSRLI